MALGILFGLLAGGAWGLGDFAGGLASRRALPLVVTAAATVVGLVLLLALLAVLRPEMPAASILALGLVGGMAGGLGLACLYQALSIGSMGIGSALAAAGATLIPVVVTAVLGTELAPVTVLGIGAIIGAGVMATEISRDRASRSALILSLLAGLGFATWYLVLDQAAGEHPLWALVASRTGSSALLCGLVAVTAARHAVGGLRPVLPIVLLAGLLDVSANAFFVLSADAVSVALAAPLSGLYPLATMAAARVALGERLPRLGLLSVVLAVAGIVLISLDR
jgi:drug/metabolite transporter (DMT)-like permease